jgi:hypothetical protein
MLGDQRPRHDVIWVNQNGEFGSRNHRVNVADYKGRFKEF